MSQELIGYTDRWSFHPGETVGFRVSTTAPSYRAELVRLRHGAEHPDGPGFRERVVAGALDEVLPGRRQLARCGSCIVVPAAGALAELTSFTAATWVWPTALERPGEQGLVSTLRRLGGAGWALVLAGGRLQLVLGDGERSFTLGGTSALHERRWYFVCGSWDADAGTARLWHAPCEPLAGEPPMVRAEDTAAVKALPEPDADLLLGAAAREPDGDRRTWASGHLDGKLDGPVVFDAPLMDAQVEELARDANPLAVAPGGLLATWDLGREPASSRAPDRGPRGLDGTVVNLPARAMVGHRWSARAVDPRHAPEEWSAIHFHSDDLGDAGWELDFELRLDDDLPSGVYAARLRAEGGLEDHVPFVVRPPRGRATAPILLLLPTLTYLAYANSQLDEGFGELGITGREIVPSPDDEWVMAHPEIGRSLYSVHSDGSGWCYSSRRRPIPNLRARALEWSTGLPRHFAADLYIVDWLEEKGFGYDVATDEDLHAEGAELLGRYRAVLTGTHPEYTTEPMLDALEQHAHVGGRLMYLGGNGFWWVTGVDPEATAYIEVRRGYSASRSWESHPGELHLSTTGEQGGLWRHRGRPSNRLTGVGYAAQGFDVEAPGYQRTPESYGEDVAWIFDGVDGATVGDFGLHMGGAAGDEIDRVDQRLGSPPGTVILATAHEYSSCYQPCLADVQLLTPRLFEERNGLVQANLTYLEHAGGGAVFSASAISWCGSLSHNGYDNSVSRVTENVVRRFAGAR